MVQQSNPMVCLPQQQQQQVLLCTEQPAAQNLMYTVPQQQQQQILLCAEQPAAQNVMYTVPQQQQQQMLLCTEQPAAQNLMYTVPQQQQQQQQILLCTEQPAAQNSLCTVPQQQYICVANTSSTINNQLPVCSPQSAQPIIIIPATSLQQPAQIQCQPLQLFQNPQAQLFQSPQAQPAQYLQITSASPQFIQTVQAPGAQNMPSMNQGMSLSFKFSYILSYVRINQNLHFGDGLLLIY
jgi:hypothetical protein